MRCVSFLAGVLALAPLAAAQVTTTYQPTRDTFMRGGTTDLHGSSPNGRASKAFIDFYITDFDRPAIKAAIEAQLGRPLTQADMQDVEFKWYLFSNDFQGYQPQSLSRPAVFQGTTDWTEGTNQTLGATKGFAHYDPSGATPNLPWTRNDGSAVAGFINLDKVQNAVFEEWGGQAYTYRAWTLDDDVAYTYLTDPLSLGLFLNAADTTPYGDAVNYNNTEVYSRDTGNIPRRPYLEVTVVPEPASSCGLLLAAVALARRRPRRVVLRA
jgi:hypothetical protein